jgi:hypothetical protein
MTAVRSARPWALLLVLALLAVLLPFAVAPPASAAELPAGSSRLVTVAPARVMDTRSGIGVPAGARAPGSVVQLPVAGTGAVPAGATAVVLNVTLTQAAGPGFVQVFPTGRSALGTSSNLNVERAGQTIPNLVTVPVGDQGRVSFYLQSGGHVLADVFGYYEPSATATAAGRFEALSPVRILDTRSRIGMPAWPAHPGDTRNCSDFGTWSQANTWFWTYYYDFGDVAKLDGDGDLLPCASLPGAPSSKQQLPRLPKPKAAAGTATRVQVTGVGGVPASGVSAVALNVTATQADGTGYVQAVPASGPTPYGASSNLNTERAGQTIPNLVVVPVGASGAIDLYTSVGTHLLADVAGYFTSTTAATSTAGLFVPLPPARALDTRNPAFGTPMLTAGRPLDYAPLGRVGLPQTGVSAVLYNVTATQSLGGGFVQVYPTGRGTPASSSNLNLDRAGQTIPNAALAATGTQGRTSIYSSVGTHIILDVSGYYTDGAAGGGGTGDPALSGLVIATPNTTATYNRDAWSVWIDADRDCQDTRAEVLIAESSAPVTLNATGCTVVGGRWVDPYTGTAWTLASDVDVDHTVPLADAHRSGGWAWDAGKKAQYGNDLASPEHLIAIEDNLNQAKGDKSPDQWQPPLASSRCDYANNWIAIKKRWSLTVTQAEYNTLATTLAGCA